VASEIWNAWAAIASAVSAVAALTALCFSAHQNGQNAAALSLSSAQKFSEECRELWTRYRECIEDPDGVTNCLNDILGSFELFSIAVNDGTLTPRVREYIVETICDYLDGMVGAGCHDYIQPATEKAHVCKELKNLVVQNQSRFENAQAVAAMLNIPKSSIA